MPKQISFTTAFALSQAHLYEPEQVNYYIMLLRNENARRKDNLSFRPHRTNYLDVYFNPLYVIMVTRDEQDVLKVNEYVRAVRETT